MLASGGLQTSEKRKKEKKPHCVDKANHHNTMMMIYGVNAYQGCQLFN